MTILKLKIETLESSFFSSVPNEDGEERRENNKNSVISMLNSSSNEFELLFDNGEIYIRGGEQCQALSDGANIKTLDYQIRVEINDRSLQEDEALSLLQRLSPEITFNQQLKKIEDKAELDLQEDIILDDVHSLSNEQLPESLSFLYAGLQQPSITGQEIATSAPSQTYLQRDNEIADCSSQEVFL